jgi:hypothetical protein
MQSPEVPPPKPVELLDMPPMPPMPPLVELGPVVLATTDVIGTPPVPAELDVPFSPPEPVLLPVVSVTLLPHAAPTPARPAPSARRMPKQYVSTRILPPSRPLRAP